MTSPRLVLNLIDIATDARHELLVASWAGLEPGERMLVHLDADPHELLYPLQLIYDTELELTPYAEGPLAWSFALGRRALD